MHNNNNNNANKNNRNGTTPHHTEHNVYTALHFVSFALMSFSFTNSECNAMP